MAAAAAGRDRVALDVDRISIELSLSTLAEEDATQGASERRNLPLQQVKLTQFFGTTHQRATVPFPTDAKKACDAPLPEAQPLSPWSAFPRAVRAICRPPLPPHASTTTPQQLARHPPLARVRLGSLSPPSDRTATPPSLPDCRKRRGDAATPAEASKSVFGSPPPVAPLFRAKKARLFVSLENAGTPVDSDAEAEQPAEPSPVLSSPTAVRVRPTTTTTTAPAKPTTTPRTPPPRFLRSASAPESTLSRMCVDNTPPSTTTTPPNRGATPAAIRRQRSVPALSPSSAAATGAAPPAVVTHRNSTMASPDSRRILAAFEGGIAIERVSCLEACNPFV
ncbi:hypothetical protein DFJ73DRAFT_893307 [Zopfochytrium polystomum]|nr:hypothetical protein DFJ73DRAFT_893307 [Zopfochytrium polystomum]